MAAAFVSAGLTLPGRCRIEGVTRWLFIISGVICIGSLVVLAVIFRENLGYLFEVTAILIDWVVLIVGGVLLGVLFRRKLSIAAARQA